MSRRSAREPAPPRSTASTRNHVGARATSLSLVVATIGLCGLAVALPTAVAAAAPAPSAALSHRAECSYQERATKAEPEPEIEPHGPCVTVDAAGTRTFDRAMLAAVVRDEAGLGAVALDDGWYYVDRAGRSVRVLAWDNGPDPFAEGLARVERDGKIGFVDRNFAVVIAPRYDFAWPFDGGRAMVCVGCAAEHSEEGEHPAVVGGHWGFIDRAGREVMPIRYSRDEALAASARPAASPSP
jgi:hypothetical protein